MWAGSNTPCMPRQRSRYCPQSRNARVYPLVSAIESGVWRAATSPACLQELRRALAYVQVKLEPAAQALAFERYLAHSVVLEFPDAALAPDLPLCEDPDDQKFLELAWQVRASHLVTFTVLAPDAFICWMTGPAH
ncbi:MAG: PIN domain-containing protein [Proteobacteria bacterium]|nr:PIN domain-containing protein [Pseudomonadota bacterium]